MTMVEIIHLRLAGGSPRDLERLIWEAAGASGERTAIRCYRRADLPGDLAVHIDREAGAGGAGASEAGIRLAALLKDYGMVSHSVWTECLGPGGNFETAGRRGDPDGN